MMMSERRDSKLRDFLI